MKILLTNDDGYDSKGIHLLKDILAKYATVVIVAPKEPMSAKSVSITLQKGINIEKAAPNIYVCEGTPADCVSFGLIALNADFDLVVSGCNNGFNLSFDTMYSGTVGAALEALTYGVPSIAVSCEFNFEIVEKYFEKVFQYIINNKMLSKEYLLNINFPIGDEVLGFKLSNLYYNVKQYDYFFLKEIDGYHAYRKETTDYSDDKNSDCYLVRNGYVSITPLSRSYFNKAILDKLERKIS